MSLPVYPLNWSQGDISTNSGTNYHWMSYYTVTRFKKARKIRKHDLTRNQYTDSTFGKWVIFAHLKMRQDMDKYH